MTGELYRYQGQWKFNAIGSGFQGGLSELCGNFGVEVADAPPAPTIIPQPIIEQPPINLTKVELKKKGEAISLKKTSANLGQIVVNLNWNRKTKPSIGFLSFNNAQGVDLDLGCLYEMSDGYKGCIQALGGNFGEYLDFPYMALESLRMEHALEPRVKIGSTIVI